MLGKMKHKRVLFPQEFLDWQVDLRRRTMEEGNGAPHVGVAPLLGVTAPGVGAGMSSHAIICGLLPVSGQLDTKTREFRELYESRIGNGARATYDAGIAYLKDYYQDAANFDPASISTLLAKDSYLIRALKARAACSLVFYVFNLEERTGLDGFRCLQLNCRAELHGSGPVYENVWWHNSLFHGPADHHVVVQFHHESSWETAFGRMDPVPAG